MKIIKFKKNTNGSYKVFLDNGRYIYLYEDVIINNNLLFNKYITDELLETLIKQNDNIKIYNMALNYISIRIRSEKEVRDYLNKKQVDKEIIENTILKLTKDGYINDFKFAKAFTNDQMVLSASGPYKIKNMLIKYGISEEIALEVIEEIDENIVKEKLSNLLEKQVKLKKGGLNMIKIKLLNYFINLGYDKEMILQELNSFDIKVDVNYLQKEYDKLYNKYKKKYEGETLKRFVINKLYSKGYSSSEISKIKDSI